MNASSVSAKGMMPVDSIVGDSAADTNLLRKMAAEAHEFMCEKEWCERIDSQHFAYGVGGVVAVFLFQITPNSEDVDSSLWVIVGDLPPAYIVAEDNPTVADALDGYCSEMEAWVEAVEKGESVEDLIPVNVPPTSDHAGQLRGRVEFLRTRIMPLVRAS